MLGLKRLGARMEWSPGAWCRILKPTRPVSSPDGCHPIQRTVKLAGKMLGKALLALLLAAPLAVRGAEELAALVDPVLGAGPWPTRGPAS